MNQGTAVSGGNYSETPRREGPTNLRRECETDGE